MEKNINIPSQLTKKRKANAWDRSCFVESAHQSLLQFTRGKPEVSYCTNCCHCHCAEVDWVYKSACKEVSTSQGQDRSRRIPARLCFSLFSLRNKVATARLSRGEIGLREQQRQGEGCLFANCGLAQVNTASVPPVPAVRG